MKGTSDKCYLIFSSSHSTNIQVANSLIKNSNYDKLLCLKTDCSLTSYEHIKRTLEQEIESICPSCDIMTLEKERISISFFKFFFENLNTGP